MTDSEFDAVMARSGLPLSAASLAEIRQGSFAVLSMIDRVSRDKPREAEPAVMFYPEQRP